VILSVLLDQNVPPVLAEFLTIQRPDWIVRHVRDVGLNGAADQEAFEWAKRHEAIVITFDEDFADTRMYAIGTHAGVIRLRIWPTTTEATEAALGRLLATTPDAVLAGSLVVIDNQRIRIRRTARHG
jgi:predicted nuclease of predicted toxin-antitoxin system